jgi:hypothetical protein
VSSSQVISEKDKAYIKFAASPPHHTEQKSLKRKAATSRSHTDDTQGIFMMDEDLEIPEQPTCKTSPAKARKVHYDIDSKREKKIRTIKCFYDG